MSDEKAVGEAIANLTKAMLAADKASLAALTMDQLDYGHSSGKVETKAQFLDVVGGRKTIYKSIELHEPKLTVAGNFAIARHIFDNHTETDGKPGSARVNVQQVWIKDDGRWRLLARQAFRT